MFSDFTSITPKSWVTLQHHMIRLRTWELTESQILEAVRPFIKDGAFKLVVRTEKDGDPIGYSCLLVEKESDMDRIRCNELVVGESVTATPSQDDTTTSGQTTGADQGATSGTENRPSTSVIPRTVIKKTQKYVLPEGHCRYTIKTTAPLWVTKQMIKDIFDQYSSDQELYTLNIDGKICENQRYPIVRTSPRWVTRHGEKILVNVVYVEYSPKPGHEDDALVAQSMQYRTFITNPANPEERISLIFNPWIVDKSEAKESLHDRKKLYEERVRQRGMPMISSRGPSGPFGDASRGPSYSATSGPLAIPVEVDKMTDRQYDFKTEQRSATQADSRWSTAERGSDSRAMFGRNLEHRSIDRRDMGVSIPMRSPFVISH